jgi:hypothetical protein
MTDSPTASHLASHAGAHVKKEDVVLHHIRDVRRERAPRRLGLRGAHAMTSFPCLPMFCFMENH